MTTGSALDRIEACPGSEKLPHIIEPASADASRGTIIHAYLQGVAEHGAEEALARTDAEHRAMCAAIDLDRLPVRDVAAEVAFAWDPVTGEARELGRGLDRDYSAAPDGWICGTADAVALVEEDAVYVGDYKSGHRPPRAAELLALAFYGVCAARAYGRSRAILEVLRIADDGTTWPDRIELDALELAEVETRIRRALEAVAAADGRTVRPGEHCRYCPAFRACPNTLAIARELTISDGHLPELNEQTAPAAFVRVRQIEKVLQVVKKELAEYAKLHPFATDNGKTYGPRPWSVRSVDPSAAWRVLAETYGEDVANTALPRSGTITGIEAALKPIAIADGSKVAPFVRKAMERLEGEGAITTTTTEQIREH